MAEEGSRSGRKPLLLVAVGVIVAAIAGLASFIKNVETIADTSTKLIQGEALATSAVKWVREQYPDSGSARSIEYVRPSDWVSDSPNGWKSQMDRDVEISVNIDEPEPDQPALKGGIAPTDAAIQVTRAKIIGEQHVQVIPPSGRSRVEQLKMYEFTHPSENGNAQFDTIVRQQSYDSFDGPRGTPVSYIMSCSMRRDVLQKYREICAHFLRQVAIHIVGP